MYIGLSGALPPRAKDCNYHMIEFQNKLGPGQIMRYGCQQIIKGEIEKNVSLKFNEKLDVRVFFIYILKYFSFYNKIY